MSASSFPLSAGLAADCRLSSPDSYFQLLNDACQDLDESAGHLLHAQLVLLLMNHVGDEAVLREAIVIARQGLKLFPASSSRAASAHREGVRP